MSSKGGIGLRVGRGPHLEQVLDLEPVARSSRIQSP